MKLNERAGLLTTAAIVGLACASTVLAWGNEVRHYGYKAAMADPIFVERAPAGVKLYFADQPVTVTSDLGETKSQRKRPTPARKTPISTACRTVARDALVAMALDAQKRGGNAVVGIRSRFDGNTGGSRDEYDCAIGAQMLAVALSGTVAIVE